MHQRSRSLSGVQSVGAHSTAEFDISCAFIHEFIGVVSHITFFAVHSHGEPGSEMIHQAEVELHFLADVQIAGAVVIRHCGVDIAVHIHTGVGIQINTPDKIQMGRLAPIVQSLLALEE